MHEGSRAKGPAGTAPSVIIHSGIVGVPTQSPAALAVVIFLHEQLRCSRVQEHLFVRCGVEPLLHQNEQILSVTEQAGVTSDSAQGIGIPIGHLTLVKERRGLVN